MKNKPLLSAIVALIICIAVYWLFWGDRTAIVTTLGGEVCAVKSVGDTVKEGDALLRVKTSLGNAVAARATVNGEIIEVLIKIGDDVKPKTKVIVIKEK